MNTDMIDAVKVISDEKGINADLIFEAIEEGLAVSYKKTINKDIEVTAKIDSNTGEIEYFQTKKIVREVENEDAEIALEDILEYDENAEEGDLVQFLLPKKDLSRIATQLAKNIIMQKIRDEERKNLFEIFKEKEHELVTGTIQRKINSTYFINIGRTEAILPRRHQVKKDNYQKGEKIKVYILEVKDDPRGPRIIASRTHRDFVRKLFEFYISEVFDKTIEIKNISRDPGARTKISVLSHDSNVDPVGTCVGSRGNRIQAIVREMNGEKIDVIPYDDSPEIYIKNALKPAQVESVTLNLDEQAAIVIVPKEQYSLAIGRGGQNVMLAAKLTGWKIDIKTGMVTTEQALLEAEALFKTAEEVSGTAEEKTSENKAEITELKDIPGLGEKNITVLNENNVNTVEDLKNISMEDLLAIPGIGQKTAEKIKEAI